MDDVLALRPFVPAREFDLSLRFYEALGFRTTMREDKIAGLKLGSFGFILQDYYVREFAENLMLQIMVRDVAAWWIRVNEAELVATFGVKPPREPAIQPWGMKVGFLFDPSGVLWHIAEAPF